MSVEMEGPSAKKIKFESAEFDIFEPNNFQSNPNDLPDELLNIDDQVPQPVAASCSSSMLNNNTSDNRVSFPQQSTAPGPGPSYSANVQPAHRQGQGAPMVNGNMRSTPTNSVLQGLLSQSPGTSTMPSSTMPGASGHSDNAPNNMNYGGAGPRSVPGMHAHISSPQRPPTAPGQKPAPGSVPATYARSPAGPAMNVLSSPPPNQNMPGNAPNRTMNANGPRSNGPMAMPPGVSGQNVYDDQQNGGPPAYTHAMMNGGGQPMPGPGFPGGAPQQRHPAQNFRQPQYHPRAQSGNNTARMRHPNANTANMPHMNPQHMIRPGVYGGPQHGNGYPNEHYGQMPMSSQQQQHHGMMNAQMSRSNGPPNTNAADFGSPQPNIHSPQFTNGPSPAQQPRPSFVPQSNNNQNMLPGPGQMNGNNMQMNQNQSNVPVPVYSGQPQPSMSNGAVSCAPSQSMQAPPNVSLPPNVPRAPMGQQNTPHSNTPPRAPAMPAVNNNNNNQDSEKRRLIQQQLVLLLHAHKCQQRESQQPNGQMVSSCTLPHCSTMKGVLAHMTACQAGRTCTFAHCASSRQIISHWKNCNREDCPVCMPLRQFNDKKNSDPAQGPHSLLSGAMGPNGPLSGNFAMNGPASLGNIDMLTSPPNQVAPNMSLGGGNGPNPVPTHSSGGKAPPVYHSHPRSVLEVSHGPAGDMPLNPPNSLLSPTGGSNRMPPEFNNLPPPDQPSNQKDWHRLVTPDLRNHLVSKLVKAIFPAPDKAALNDSRLKDLIAYARKVEKDMFEQADDREEYYHLLAEKIYKIQKELQEKKQIRQQTQRIGGGTANPMLNPISHSVIESEMRSVDTDVPPNRTAPLPSSGMPVHSTAMQMPGKVKLEPPSSNASSFAMAPSSMQPVKQENEGAKSVKQEEQDSALCMRQSVKPGPSARGVAASKLSSAVDASLAAAPAKPKTFSSSELLEKLIGVWSSVNNMDEAIPFQVPVDPELLLIPDYFQIIKTPMDLSTIKAKLEGGQYANPWQFCDDMWLMFDNAWLYNRKNSKVYKYCTKISETFEDKVNPVMQELGFCCGQKLSFTPLPIFCYGQPMCTIARDQPYYCYEYSSTSFDVNVTEKYTYCPKCYESMADTGINLSDDPQQLKMVAKNEFKLFKNDQIDNEPFLNCTHCGRKWHQICALHHDKITPNGFICENCRCEIDKPRPENRFTAKRLPHCVLSRFIENRVNDFLKDKEQANTEVVIRVLNTSEKEVDVKPHMKQRYSTPPSNFPEKFPYRSKAIFAFEVIEGTEVCFFGLHVQEYGSECAAPNARRVYIAYLDSVNFFTPRELRTLVYHQILLGYLQYCKQLGYTMAHIWACPPSEGDDYIFHIHPPEQKIPKPKRLQDWYRKMLDRGIIERTVADYNDIHKQAQQDNLSTPCMLPYFEGDYWPNVLEDCIREVDTAEAQRRHTEEVADNDDLEDDDLYEDGQGNSQNATKKKNQKTNKKKTNKNKTVGNKKKKQGANDVVDKLYTCMEKNKDVFFTIRLSTVQNQAQLPPINDPDPLSQSELMDGRDTFLNRAREEHWEFSSLRRAKFSTLCLCHALHTVGKEALTYTCNTCQNTNARYHCTTCTDFDLCNDCYKVTNHEHKAEMVLLNFSDDGDQQQQQTQDPNDRTASIQRCIQSLVHACQCRNVHCRRLSCHKMKRVVQHTKGCKKRQQGNCPVCKQLIALCCYHAKHCHDPACQVPFCTNIRQKLQEQKQAQRRQADRMMMRRMMTVHQQNGAVPNQLPIPNGKLPQGTLLGAMPQNQPGNNQMGPVQSHQMGPSSYLGPPQHMQPNSAVGVSQQRMPGPGPGINPSGNMPAGMQQSPQFNNNGPSMMNPPPYARPQHTSNPNMPQQGTVMRHPSGNGWDPINSQMAPDNMMMQSGQQGRGVRGPYPPHMVQQGMPVVNQQVNEVVNRLKMARNQEEKDIIMNDVKQNPQVFAALCQVIKNLQSPSMRAQNMGMDQSQQQRAQHNMQMGAPAQGPAQAQWQGQANPQQQQQQQQMYMQQNGQPVNRYMDNQSFAQSQGAAPANMANMHPQQHAQAQAQMNAGRNMAPQQMLMQRPGLNRPPSDNQQSAPYR